MAKIEQGQAGPIDTAAVEENLRKWEAEQLARREASRRGDADILRPNEGNRVAAQSGFIARAAAEKANRSGWDRGE